MAHSYDFHKFSKFSYAVLSGIGMEYQTSHMLLLRRELFTNKQDRETLDSCAKLIIHNYRALSLNDCCRTVTPACGGHSFHTILF